MELHTEENGHDLKDSGGFCNIIGANINLAAFILWLTEEKEKRAPVMMPVMIFISSLYDAFNEFDAGTNSVDSRLLCLILSAIFISSFYYNQQTKFNAVYFIVRFAEIDNYQKNSHIFSAETLRKVQAFTHYLCSTRKR